SQWHLKWSKGSRQLVHRYRALQGVEPNSLTRVVSRDPQRGQAMLSSDRSSRLGLETDCAGGAMPYSRSLRRPSSVIQSLVHGGDSTSLTSTRSKPASRSACPTLARMTSVAGQPAERKSVA